MLVLIFEIPISVNWTKNRYKDYACASTFVNLSIVYFYRLHKRSVDWIYLNDNEKDD
jgi:hypothetical protein